MAHIENPFSGKQEGGYQRVAVKGPLRYVKG